MPAERIAENLAFINWTLLTALAIGSLGAVILARLRTDATRGFLAFTAACAVVFGALAYLSDRALPVTLGDSPIVVNAAFDEPRRVAFLVLVGLTAIYTVALARGHRAPLLAGLCAAAAVAVLVFAALAWGGGPLGTVPLLLQLALLAVATGGVFAAMILGHWYLVTPRISEQPLVLTTRLLSVAIALQLLLFLVWLAVGYPGQPPFAALTGPQALFVWLRLIVGILFPLLLTWMAWKTAQTRSMESATGLLYIELALVLASTIVAAGLAFSVGLLV